MQYWKMMLERPCRAWAMIVVLTLCLTEFSMTPSSFAANVPDGLPAVVDAASSGNPERAQSTDPQARPTVVPPGGERPEPSSNDTNSEEPTLDPASLDCDGEEDAVDFCDAPDEFVLLAAATGPVLTVPTVVCCAVGGVCDTYGDDCPYGTTQVPCPCIQAEPAVLVDATG